MAETNIANRDSMSRAATRQLLWIAGAAVVGLAVLLAALGWAATMTGGGAAASHGLDFKTRTVTTSIRNDLPQLDSTRAKDSESYNILHTVMEGLLRYDVNSNLVPGVAERWEVDGNRATFWLRDTARWSDGKPVTAHDFVFAWRLAVDPATASDYAFLLYPVRNGEAINRGELPTEALGVRAAGDHVLEVELENPIAYFPKLTAAWTYYPIREDFFKSRNGRYAADAEDMLYNGPFRITRWVHGASLRMEKSEQYWDKDSIWLNAIDIAYITRDAVARLNLYQDGRVADADYLPGEALDQVLQQRWPLRRFQDGSMWFIELNFREGRITRNFHFRRALQLANDSAELVNKVLKTPSYTVADSLFPSTTRGEHGWFRQEYPPPRVTPDLAEARKELELARQELGLEEFPPLVFLVDDLPAGITHSEYLQEYLRRNLGLEIRIDRQNFAQRLEKQQQGEFDLTLKGWSADYDDPLSFADLFASWNLNNNGRYANPALDEQVRIAQVSLDEGERLRAFAEVQRILIEDAVILPAYERGVMYVQDPRLKNVARRFMGPPVDYSRAYITEEP
ncbi:MAG TPA: peptide ABC transporter substrate-binding protein [Gammaproteobacteria bacterium]